jgi:hypothetical protein
LADFPIHANLTLQELVTRMGPPAFVTGSGIEYQIYELTSGEVLVLTFDLAPGDGRLSYAFVQPPGNRDIARRKTIYEYGSGAEQTRPR